MNAARSTLFFVLATHMLSGCATTHRVTERTATAEKTDTTAAAVREDYQHGRTALDAAASRTETARETAAAESDVAEETTTTVFDPATGRPASITTTKRRAASRTETARETAAAGSTQYRETTETAAFEKAAEFLAGHSELKQEEKTQTIAKKAGLSLAFWVLAGGITLATLAGLAAYWHMSTGGGPVLWFWWLVGLFRRKPSQVQT